MGRALQPRCTRVKATKDTTTLFLGSMVRDYREYLFNNGVTSTFAYMLTNSNLPEIAVRSWPTYGSSCTCAGEDHPGPTVSKGRGSPEIDVLEAQKNKLGPGAKVSQSAQFAPFSHDYFYENTSENNWWINNPDITQPNAYRCLSTLTTLNLFIDSIQGLGCPAGYFWADGFTTRYIQRFWRKFLHFWCAKILMESLYIRLILIMDRIRILDRS